MTNQNNFLHLTSREMLSLSRVAQGKETADLIIRDARLVNVYTSEIQDHQNIGIKGRCIALVGEDAPAAGPDTQIIDAQGKTLIPGLIDGHTHLGFWTTVHEFLIHAITGGTTTIITESLEIMPVGGYDGMCDFLASLKDQPIKLLATAPPMVSISRAAAGVPPDIMEALAQRDDILGMGESYWQNILQSPKDYLPNFEIMLRHKKTLEGHSAGASGSKLGAYAAMGISSCHESISAEDALKRLRLGLYVMIREGSIRRDLKAVAGLLESPVDFRRMILSTDGVSPADLVETGYMEYPVQKAIDYGFDPVCAVQMATLNVAEHFGLDHLIGGIAPGRLADMVLIPDPGTIRAEFVISNGRIISRDKALCTAPRRHIYAPASLDSIHLPRKLDANDFKIQVPDANASQAAVRVIEMVTDLVTKETRDTLPVDRGELVLPVDRRLIKISAVDRAIAPGRMFTGLVKGFGLKQGAMASSAAWDTSCIIVAGADDTDMASAVNHIRRIKGGLVVCCNGNILFELGLPVFGIISDLPVKKIADKMEELKTVLEKLGADFPDPALSLNTMTGAAIPYLRICEQGLVNLKDGIIKNLFV